MKHWKVLNCHPHRKARPWIFSRYLLADIYVLTITYSPFDCRHKLKRIILRAVPFQSRSIVVDISVAHRIWVYSETIKIDDEGILHFPFCMCSTGLTIFSEISRSRFRFKQRQETTCGIRQSRLRFERTWTFCPGRLRWVLNANVLGRLLCNRYFSTFLNIIYTQKCARLFNKLYFPLDLIKFREWNKKLPFSRDSNFPSFIKVLQVSRETLRFDLFWVIILKIA